MAKTKTEGQFDREVEHCRVHFHAKTRAEGTPWRALPPSEMTQLLYEKIMEIRTYEEEHERTLSLEVRSRYFVELLNLTVTALIQLASDNQRKEELGADKALGLYNEQLTLIRELMMKKNHDYGEAWRDMRPTSFTDLILMKLIRIRQIEKNNGQTIISEGIDAGYQDIVNYSIFTLIKMSEEMEQ